MLTNILSRENLREKEADREGEARRTLVWMRSLSEALKGYRESRRTFTR